MKYRVNFTVGAERDLVEIWDYVAEHDSPEKAKSLVEHINRACSDLSDMPQRGTYPREMILFGIRNFREVFLKPYRVICEIEKKTLVIYLIADGRRDMKTLLQKRLLDIE